MYPLAAFVSLFSKEHCFIKIKTNAIQGETRAVQVIASLSRPSAMRPIL